jgi:hypothetical protein
MEALDPLTVLTSVPGSYPRSYIVPGAATLELGATTVQAPPAAGELGVVIVDEQATMVRVAVKLDALAFAVWTERARLLGIVAHEHRVSEYAGGGFYDFSDEAPVAELRPGARVRMLGHRDTSTQIRYLGELEIDGWVPDSALVDRTTADPSTMGRIPTGQPTLMVTPGTVIRSEPKWVARQIAVMANGYFVDTIKEIDDAWALVGYEDGDIHVRGFASRRDPPERVHKPHEAEVAPAVITANATIAKGTCLYAKPRGEPIGFVIEDRAAEFAATRTSGWFTVAFDTPWGPLTFAAQGRGEQDLETCGPVIAPPPPPPAP